MSSEPSLWLVTAVAIWQDDDQINGQNYVRFFAARSEAEAVGMFHLSPPESLKGKKYQVKAGKVPSLQEVIGENQ